MFCKINHLLKDKKAAIFIMMLLMIFVLFVFLMALVEVTKVYSVTYDVETKLRRLVNNCVEDNIDDEWRMDGYNYLNTQQAETDFRNNFIFYTDTTPNPNRYIAARGFLYGNKMSDAGDFLYLIDISGLQSSRGDNGSEPMMKCTGTLYIAPSIPGALNREGDARTGNFVFEIPFIIESTNFRTDGTVSGSLP